MKTALLHYWLINQRGGENVFREICGMFPEGEVFTHALGPAMRDPEKVERTGGGGQWCGHPVHESFIAKLPWGRKRPQAYLPLMPLANRSFKLDGYELMVSSESGPIKGIRKPAGAKHICYCHTPMRYLWDMKDEYFRTADWKGKLAMKFFLRYLQREDLKSAESVDTFIANSQFVAERIRRTYGRESTVVYPPVEVEFYSAPSNAADIAPYKAGTYYLLVGQLTEYKRPELAMAACHRRGCQLLVVGTGGMLPELMKSKYPEVAFLGRVPDAQLAALYANAKALLFPGIEDFGIVPVEAQAAGTPVIAYGGGGALETIVSDKTGMFFQEQTVDGLCEAIEEFEARTWSAEACRNNASRFAKVHFQSAMAKVLSQTLQ